jgi:hypothetical protein
MGSANNMFGIPRFSAGSLQDVAMQAVLQQSNAFSPRQGSEAALNRLLNGPSGPHASLHMNNVGGLPDFTRQYVCGEVPWLWSRLCPNKGLFTAVGLTQQGIVHRSGAYSLPV